MYIGGFAVDGDRDDSDDNGSKNVSNERNISIARVSWCIFAMSSCLSLFDSFGRYADVPSNFVVAAATAAVFFHFQYISACMRFSLF